MPLPLNTVVCVEMVSDNVYPLLCPPQELGATFSTPPERLALNYMEGMLHFPARRQALEASYNMLNTPTKRVMHALNVLLAVCPRQTWVRPTHIPNGPSNPRMPEHLYPPYSHSQYYYFSHVVRRVVCVCGSARTVGCWCVRCCACWASRRSCLFSRMACP